LSADGHEKVAVVGKRGVEKVVERLEKNLLFARAGGQSRPCYP
jgi:hypothetical protein